MYGGSECTDVRILNLGTRWRWVVSFTRQPLYTRYPLDRSLGGPQSRFGHGGEENNSLPLSGIEPRSSNQYPSHYTDWAISDPDPALMIEVIYCRVQWDNNCVRSTDAEVVHK
jgi:hypothetical protein